jgi:stearoyl-CoA desaturase (Delta-9 desaturase)
MTTSTAVRPQPRRDRDPKPMVLPGRSVTEQILVKIFVLLPFAALVVAVPIA